MALKQNELLGNGWAIRIRVHEPPKVPVFEYRKGDSGEWIPEEDAWLEETRLSKSDSRVHELTQMLQVAEGALMSCAEALEDHEPYVAEAAWKACERSKAFRKSAK